MSTQLRQYNPAQDQAVKDQVLKDNFQIIQNRLNVLGSQLLNSMLSSDNESILGASGDDYAAIPGFSAAFRLSAGFLAVDAALQVKLNTGFGAIALFVDGLQVATKLVEPTQKAVSFTYRTQMVSGPHSVEFRWKTDAGSTFQLNAAETLATPSSEAFVVEHFVP